MSQLQHYHPGDLPCGARLATAIAPVESHETTERLAALLQEARLLHAGAGVGAELDGEHQAQDGG